MDNLLEKIDEVVKRTNCTYKEAQEALNESEGDIIKAVISIEEKSGSNKSDNVKKKGQDILNEIKKIIEKGNVTKITIKRKGEVILNIPITAGAVGVVIAPFLSLAGVTAALLTECTIEIVKSTGEIVYVNEEVNKGVNNIKEGIDNIKDKFNNNNN